MSTEREALAAEALQWISKGNALVQRLYNDAPSQTNNVAAGTWMQYAMQLLSALATAEQAPAALTVPEGWQLVPVVPTDAMLEAGRYVTDSPRSAYELMLDATPSTHT